jgi:hypothetical protein
MMVGKRRFSVLGFWFSVKAIQKSIRMWNSRPRLFFKKVFLGEFSSLLFFYFIG